MTRPLWIVAGGTGGHIFPALSLADRLDRNKHSLMMITDRRGQPLISAHRSCTVLPAASPFAGSPLRRLGAMLTLLAGAVSCCVLMLKHRPTAIIGFGGYPAFVPLALGRLFRIPVGLHEQNAVMGKANRMLASLSECTMTSWPHTKGLPDNVTPIHTGLPVRAGFTDLSDYRPVPDGPLHIVISGGSLGARLFGEVIPQAICSLAEDIRARLSIIHQVRDEQRETVEAFYNKHGISAQISSFFSDMPALMATADILICRAGASSVAEVSAAGRAAILVPFAAAADNHQHANAEVLASAGGAIIIPEPELTAERLSGELDSLARSDEKRTALAHSARTLHTQNAAEAMYQAIHSTLRPLSVQEMS